MKLLDFPHSANIVTFANHSLFSGVAAATLTPLLAATAQTFKIKATIGGGTANTGTIVITGTTKTETLAFTGAGFKLGTNTYSAITSITTTGLADEATKPMILIECLDTTGAPITKETLTPIKIKYEYTTSGFWLDGKWTAYSGSYAMTRSKLPVLNDVIRYGGIDHTVIRMEPLDWLNGKELYRILYF